MRRYVLYLAFALSVFGIVSIYPNYHVLAQEKSVERSISESDFKEVLSKADSLLNGKIYRMTKTEETFTDRETNPQRVETNILETVPPNKRREVEVIKSATENSRTERIWDGKNFYKKENDGKWQKFSGGGGLAGSFVSGRISNTFKFVGEESLNGKMSDVYETEMRRVANKATQTSAYQVEYVTKTKYWFSENGQFLKIIRNSEVVGSKSLVRETTVYEYDKNIKIEAPIK